VTGLIRGEAIKLRSTRTAIGFAIVAVALLLLVVLGSILGGNPDTISAKRDSLSVGGAVSFVLIIFGVVGATSEYRHHTLAPAVLIAPDRARLLLARALAYAVTGAALGAALIAVGLAIGVPLLLTTTDGANPGFSDYLTVAGGGVLSCGLCAALGVGAGALIGNQVAGVVGTLVFFFVVEPLAGLAWHDLPKFTISQSSGKIGGAAADPSFPFLGSLAVLVVWTAILLLLGLIRERRREVT
jgi:ABC-2 type transport system permease protein